MSTPSSPLTSVQLRYAQFMPPGLRRSTEEDFNQAKILGLVCVSSMSELSYSQTWMCGPLGFPLFGPADIIHSRHRIPSS